MARRLVLVTNRRLDDVRSGSGSYLCMGLEAARRAGYEIRLVMAPDTSFGSRPWLKLSSAIEALATAIPLRTWRIGGVFVATSWGPWIRLFRRVLIEAARRLRVDTGALGRVRGLLSVVPRDAELDAIAHVVRLQNPDLVLVEYSSLGPLLERLTGVAGRGVLMHDLFSSRAASFRAASKAADHIDITLDEEAARLRSATLILHASMNELERLAPHLPDAMHVWMRPVARVRRDALRERAPAAAFVGADHAGNREALSHLLCDIWPKVRAHAADARLLVAGAIGARVPQPAPAGVEVLGQIDDLAMLAGPDIVGLAPIRVSSGIAIKIADYMGLGMPVVAYPGGLDGFGDMLDAAALRVEGSEAFAAALVGLLTDTAARRARSTSALDLAEKALAETGIEAALTSWPVKTR